MPDDVEEVRAALLALRDALNRSGKNFDIDIRKFHGMASGDRNVVCAYDISVTHIANVSL